MTLLQLTYFAEVCRTKNFTKAAENLFVTQPTITNAVRELEQEFHVQLIERNNKMIAITEAGQDLLEMSMHLLEYSDRIKLIMEDKVQEHSRLRLGIPNMSNAAYFPHFFNVLHRAHPDMEIRTTHELSDSLLKHLDSGKLNMLIIPYLPDESRYKSLKLTDTQFLYCVSEHHPLAERTELSFRDICHEPIISFFGDRYLHRLGLAEKYRAGGGELKILYRCNQINALIDLIRNNEGCGFLLEESFTDRKGIVGIPLQEKLPVSLYLVWTKESARLSCVKKVLECFHDK